MADRPWWLRLTGFPGDEHVRGAGPLPPPAPLSRRKVWLGRVSLLMLVCFWTYMPLSDHRPYWLFGLIVPVGQLMILPDDRRRQVLGRRSRQDRS